MFRACLNLFRLWGVTDEQAAVMLDLPRRTFARWKAEGPGRIGRDGKARLSNLMGIHKALKIVFRDAARGYAWIKARPITGNHTAAIEAISRPFIYRKYLDFGAINAMRGLQDDLHRTQVV